MTVNNNSQNHHPLISIVIPSRNDSYMGNSNWRLETAINFIALQLDLLNRLDDVEVVVVDWGSETPLHDDLQLTGEGEKITRYILVPVLHVSTRS